MVLLVDDDPEFEAEADQALTAAGYCVMVAGTPSLARACAQAVGRELQVAIVDLDLPETGGMELIFSLHETLPQLKIIAISGVIQQSVMSVAKRMGAVSTCSKPVSGTQLVEAVREAIGPARRANA